MATQVESGLVESGPTESGLVGRDAVGRGRWLEYLTLGWNTVEAGVAIGAGALAGSTSLVGFGIDSLIEASSGAALLWRLHDGDKGQRREGRALRLVGLSFLALAAYVAYESVESLLKKEPPAVSYVGIGVAVAAMIVMPLLARAKRKVAVRLASAAMHADSRQSDICAYLAAILLAGLGANALRGLVVGRPGCGIIDDPDHRQRRHCGTARQCMRLPFVK